MEQFDVPGEWWLPGDPDAFVHGRLRHSEEDGTSLDLAGELSQGGARDGLYPLVHGTAGGADHTLVDCFRTRRDMNWGGSTRYETVRVNQMLRGALFDDPESLGGNAVAMALRHLTEWVTDSGIEEDIVERTGPPRPGEPVFRLATYRTLDHRAAAADGRTVVLSRHLGIDGDGVARRELTQRFTLRVDAPDPTARMPLDHLLDWASDLQDLVSIATGRTADFERVEYFDPDVTRQTPSGRRLEQPVQVIARWTSGSDADPRPVERHRLLFTYDQLGGITGVARWLDAAAAHRGGLGRVMGSRYSTAMFVSDRLMNCCAALEAFDWRTTGVERAHFRTRLTRCAELAGQPFAALVGDTDAWTAAVRDARNDVTHHLEQTVRRSSPTTLYLSQSLYYLFALCMLRASQAPADLIDRVPEHPDFRWLAPRVRELLAAS